CTAPPPPPTSSLSLHDALPISRILVGRAGLCYRTATQLELRQDHAAAVDAVHAELDLDNGFDPGFVQRWGLFLVQTCTGSKAERSEEHTSELQSRGHLVCRLLL